jgi:hypothetical protein
LRWYAVNLSPDNKVRIQKLKTLLPLLLLLTACASQPIKTPSNLTIPSGTWSSTFQYSGIKADKSKHAGTYSIVVAACDDEVRIWSNGGDGTYRTPPVKFQVDSYLGSHVISFKDEAGGSQLDWVEIQSLLLVETSSTRAHFQWTRAVSNRDLDADHSNRTFFEQGTGEFEHVGFECRKDQIQTVAAKAIAAMPPNFTFHPTPPARLN